MIPYIAFCILVVLVMWYTFRVLKSHEILSLVYPTVPQWRIICLALLCPLLVATPWVSRVPRLYVWLGRVILGIRRR